MEQRAKQSEEQLKLVRRYTKARGIALTTEAEIRHVRELGETITATTLATINQQSGKAIASAREQAKITTQNKLNGYAQQLIARSGGGKNEA